MPRAQHWLSELIDDDVREGVFKLRSTVSWAAALRFAIEERHGSDPAAQFDSCRRHFRALLLRPGDNAQKGEAYCLLYHALTSATTLLSLDCASAGRPWMYPTAVVTWYYAHYHAFRGMALAYGLRPQDNHAALQRKINEGLRAQFPHPYNMRARHLGDGTYEVELAGIRGVAARPLVDAFDGKSETARGMLAAYLQSTAGWEKEKEEQRILDKKQFPNFRSKAAREARNKKLLGEINFLHCAFRYRGNANYRDPLYLTYGTQQHHDYEEYLHNLVVSARFAVICGIAFTERVYGEERTAEFLEDLERNFRGAGTGTETEIFWRSFQTGAQSSR